MELEKLEAMGDFTIIEKLKEDVASGPIAVAKASIPYFAKGRVISSGDLLLEPGQEVVFLIDNSLELGLGFPENIVVVKGDDVVCYVEEHEAEE